MISKIVYVKLYLINNTLLQIKKYIIPLNSWVQKLHKIVPLYNLLTSSHVVHISFHHVLLKQKKKKRNSKYVRHDVYEIFGDKKASGYTE